MSRPYPTPSGGTCPDPADFLSLAVASTISGPRPWVLARVPRARGILGRPCHSGPGIRWAWVAGQLLLDPGDITTIGDDARRGLEVDL